MKTFKTSKAVLVFIKSMPDVVEMRVENKVNYSKVIAKCTKSTHSMTFPRGDYQLHGALKSISEEVAETLVEKWDSGKWNDYSRHLARVDTATEALQSIAIYLGFGTNDSVYLLTKR